MTPKYVKPYVKRGKNDAVDAEAICEAVTRPTMRFVAVKSVDQQSVLMIHRTRSLLIRQRTMLVNALRGHLAELGIVAETPDGGDARDYAAGDEFLRVGANKARVTQSEVIGSPSNTIIQGTLIEATLETALCGRSGEQQRRGAAFPDQTLVQVAAWTIGPCPVTSARSIKVMPAANITCDRMLRSLD